MAQKLERRELFSFEEVLMSNIIEQEALINLLVKKGIISKEELLEEIKELRNSQQRKNIR